MKLTANFSLEEFGLPNPSYNQTRTATLLAVMILQPLRNYMGQPVKITSGYRAAPVAGGASDSEHFYLRDEGAVDINIGTPNVKDNLKAFNWLATNCLYSIGQMIWYIETTHLHISLASLRNQAELLVCTSKANHQYKRIARSSEIPPLDKRLIG